MDGFVTREHIGSGYIVRSSTQLGVINSLKREDRRSWVINANM